ncbi:hypothetical protein CDL15_Pgr016395 [Punica granatum]|uniref:Uncharacterized protein n=1 Tax=Punica granatum TaxID=22663 RepID=A0A218XWW8_PUNGR|nr:hypothetical protein CDL15_Pgr016395 [Punica granatum]PKI47777.1 hypothetical protein CRG98_031827 [Punica granatum]
MSCHNKGMGSRRILRGATVLRVDDVVVGAELKGRVGRNCRRRSDSSCNRKGEGRSDSDEVKGLDRGYDGEEKIEGRGTKKKKKKKMQLYLPHNLDNVLPKTIRTHYTS